MKVMNICVELKEEPGGDWLKHLFKTSRVIAINQILVSPLKLVLYTETYLCNVTVLKMRQAEGAELMWVEPLYMGLVSLLKAPRELSCPFHQAGTKREKTRGSPADSGSAAILILDCQHPTYRTSVSGDCKTVGPWDSAAAAHMP